MMNARRRRKPLRLAEAADDTPHYHGHRERLRQRLIAAGADNLPDYELVEVILFASNPRGDVKAAGQGSARAVWRLRRIVERRCRGFSRS